MGMSDIYVSIKRHTMLWKLLEDKSVGGLNGASRDYDEAKLRSGTLPARMGMHLPIQLDETGTGVPVGLEDNCHL